VHDPPVLLGRPAEHVAQHGRAEQEEDFLPERRRLVLAVPPVLRRRSELLLVDVETADHAERRRLGQPELVEELEQVRRQRPSKHAGPPDELRVLDGVVRLGEVGQRRREYSIVFWCQRQLVHRVIPSCVLRRGSRSEV
jgi:hypothetical protein